jgi:hypothetical protein
VGEERGVRATSEHEIGRRERDRVIGVDELDLEIRGAVAVDIAFDEQRPRPGPAG